MTKYHFKKRNSDTQKQNHFHKGNYVKRQREREKEKTRVSEEMCCKLLFLPILQHYAQEIIFGSLEIDIDHERTSCTKCERVHFFFISSLFFSFLLTDTHFISVNDHY